MVLQNLVDKCFKIVACTKKPNCSGSGFVQIVVFFYKNGADPPRVTLFTYVIFLQYQFFSYARPLELELPLQ